MSAQKSSGPLTDLSSQFADAVETDGNGMVGIHARRRIPSSGIVWRDGVIVGASHTVRRDDAIPVTLPSGKSAVATIAGRDPATDIIALRLNEAHSPPAVRATAEAGRVGSLVLAVGRPGGAVSASFGIISAVREGWRSSWGTRIDRVLRLDLAIYDGFSGGPLVAASGGVIGINNSALARGTPAALPAAVVDRVLDELLERGHVRRAFIGIAVQPVALSAAVVKRHQLAGETALVVLSVADGSPAEAAGLSVGDVLADANGQSLSRPADLLDLLSTVPEGGTLNLKLVRGAAVATVAVTPVDRGVGAGGGVTRD